ncbi:MAG: tRNA (adenosine(37)-N6)-threonylcarbamoyltransferase complex transferase subunit TsaD, partial [Patescibacteria group bacterium]
FPRPMINSKNYNFSFSGLKTAVLYKIKELKEKRIKLTGDLINCICYEFQQAVVDVLIQKTIRAAKEYKVESILLSGGVSANELLRKTLKKETKKIKVLYSQPDFEYTGDNAAMIALAGYYKYIKNKKSNTKIKAEPNLKIKSWS